MQANDIAHLNSYLQRLYGERYAGITTEMGLLWYEDLKPYTLDLAKQAVKRWAREHLPSHAPTLEHLLTIIEEIQMEQRRQQAAQVKTMQTEAFQSRDDDLSIQAVRAIINKQWPDLFTDETEPMKGEALDERLGLLRAQAAILRQHKPEDV